MTPIQFALAFEEEWMPRYPHVKYFAVEPAIQDIAYHRGKVIPSQDRPSIVAFLCNYLKEHKDRFYYKGNNTFAVVARATTEDLANSKLRIQQSPN